MSTLRWRIQCPASGEWFKLIQRNSSSPRRRQSVECNHLQSFLLCFTKFRSLPARAMNNSIHCQSISSTRDLSSTSVVADSLLKYHSDYLPVDTHSFNLNHSLHKQKPKKVSVTPKTFHMSRNPVSIYRSVVTRDQTAANLCVSISQTRRLLMLLLIHSS